MAEVIELAQASESDVATLDEAPHHPSLQIGQPRQQAVQPDLGSYDKIIVAFSGGKDCLACVLHLLESGVDPARIELHHHLVDGREGSTLMDWPCTEGYCKAVAAALGLRISFSWRRHGFEGEMLRRDSSTGAAMVPINGAMVSIGGNGPAGTRLKFPQLSASLATRWCSSALKIDVFARWLCNDPQFVGTRTLVITGERAQESAARAQYATFEPHRSDLRNGKTHPRHIDHWRPVHAWSVQEVWQIIERWRLLAHPAYFLGWGRCSCRLCIYGSKHQWATVRKIAPQAFERVVNYEREFRVTIHRKEDLVSRADAGTPYETSDHWVRVANSIEFNEPIFMLEWQLPAGAYGESCGPT